MSGATKLQLNVNANALIKTGELFSNAVLLGANVYLIGSGLSNTIRSKKQERIQSQMQLSAEIASAVAGITKVIIEQVDHGKTDQKL